MHKKRGMLIVVSGPSGVGKDTVVREFLKSSVDCVLSVSATTRAKRAGEAHGRDYHFVSHEEFIIKIQNGEMLEWAEYNGKHYGTPGHMVERERDAGRNVILVIEVQGAMKVRKTHPEAVLVFIMPPDADALRERLRNRASDSEESILRRLHTAQAEMDKAIEYDYILTNQDIAVCAADLDTVIRAAALSPRHTDFSTQSSAR